MLYKVRASYSMLYKTPSGACIVQHAVQGAGVMLYEALDLVQHASYNMMYEEPAWFCTTLIARGAGAESSARTSTKGSAATSSEARDETGAYTSGDSSGEMRAQR